VSRPRLTEAEKARRGTIRPVRERAYSGAALAEQPLAQIPMALVPARDYLTIAEAYADDVMAGRIVACKWTRLACERQRADRQRVDADAGWAYVWDEDEAIAACHFVEHCPHVEGTVGQSNSSCSSRGRSSRVDVVRLAETRTIGRCVGFRRCIWKSRGRRRSRR
jgi:hypothetical protein